MERSSLWSQCCCFKEVRECVNVRCQCNCPDMRVLFLIAKIVVTRYVFAKRDRRRNNGNTEKDKMQEGLFLNVRRSIATVKTGESW